MPSFHLATFRLLDTEPRASPANFNEVEAAERRLGARLPASVHEWYCNESAIDILATHSNQDWPIPPRDFGVKKWKAWELLPFKYENQRVCTWAILLDGSDDPPVYVDVDSNGSRWNLQAPTFSAHVYACVWDYALVVGQPALVQAQNQPLSSEAVNRLRVRFAEQAPTFGWPGSVQYRFAGSNHAVLIWSAEAQADWFIGAGDASSLDLALRALWTFDRVGRALYDCSEIGKAVLESIRAERS
jgi:hypothetical protein